MDEKIKTKFLAIFCILTIVATFVGMEHIRSIYSQQTIELGDISFKTPKGYNYVNGSYNEIANVIIANDLNNGTNGTISYLIILQDQDNRTIRFMQYNNTLELSGESLFNLNGVSVYKDIIESVSPYYFNFNGKGYAITTPHGYDNHLIEEIVNSMKVKQ